MGPEHRRWHWLSAQRDVLSNVFVTCASGSVCNARPLVRLRAEVHYVRDLSRFDV